MAGARDADARDADARNADAWNAGARNAGERPIIFLGDLVQAAQTLNIKDPQTLLEVSVLLGLQAQQMLVLATPGEPEDVKPDQGQRVTPAPAQAGAGARFGAAAASAEAVRPSQMEKLSGEATAEGAEAGQAAAASAGTEEGGWSFEVEPLAPETAEGEPPPLPFEPLFRKQWTRGILSAAFATVSEDGDLDLDRLIDAVAARRYLAVLPRLPLPTLRRGVQVLVDRSEALTPFFRDQEELIRDIENVVGVDLISIQWFTGCPARGAGSGPFWEWESYRPPALGTVVVVLTDLGATRSLFSSELADVPEWLEFARTVRQAGCPLVALTPHAPDRWPAALLRWMTILQWDRPTSATAVRSRVGHAHRVGQ